MLAFSTDTWLGKDPLLTPHGEGMVDIGGVGRNEGGEVVTLQNGFV